jgi:hypothetical protein
LILFKLNKSRMNNRNRIIKDPREQLNIGLNID